jgi:pseudouridine kinase
VECIGVIGGIAADVEGQPFGILRPADSNPGTVEVSHGGVGRNIAENLARMGGNRVLFCSVRGDDELGRAASESLAQAGADISGVHVIPDCRTAIYMSILDNDGEMVLAVSDMSVLERLTPELVDRLLPLLSDASVIVLDANLPVQTLEHCAHVFADRKIFVDPVSVEKAKRIRSILPACTALKPNRIEAEQLVGFPIRSERDLVEAGQFFLDQGVRMVFISLGSDGLFYMEQSGRGLLAAEVIDDMSSVTGAGDAASAAIADGLARGLTADEIARQANRAAGLTLRAQQRVHPEISSFRLG